MLHVKKPIGLIGVDKDAAFRKVSNLGRRRLRAAIRQYALHQYGIHSKTANYHIDVCVIDSKLHVALDIFGNTGILV